MPDLDAVFFDLYDTLVWSDWAGVDTALAERIDVSAEEVAAAYEELRHQRDGGALPDATAVIAAVLDHCGVEPEPALVADLALWEEETLAERVVLYDDVVPTMRHLRSRGTRTGVISNCSPSTRPVIDRLGLEDEAEVVVLSCEVGVSKPDPAIFVTALEAVNVPAGRSLFVDDIPAYLDGAAEMGMHTVQIVRRPDAVESSVTHPRVGSLPELLARLP